MYAQVIHPSCHSITTMNFCFLKKHNPMLFHSSAISGSAFAIWLYLLRAPSISLRDCSQYSHKFSIKCDLTDCVKGNTYTTFTCKMAPKARSPLGEHFRSMLTTSAKRSCAFCVSLIFKYSTLISIRTSEFSGVKLKRGEWV